MGAQGRKRETDYSPRFSLCFFGNCHVPTYCQTEDSRLEKIGLQSGSSYPVNDMHKSPDFTRPTKKMLNLAKKTALGSWVGSRYCAMSAIDILNIL